MRVPANRARRALRLLVPLLLITLALSCAPSAPPAVPAPPAATSAPAPEATKAPAAAPAAAPTAAPAAAQVRTVVVEKAVEKQVVVITTPTPPSAAPTSAGQAHWARIRDAGKVIAGISAGYRPFAFYASGSDLDGFDVALVRDIARRLGLAVEFKDFPPDGLTNALQLGQVDLALGSLVSDMAANVEFTDPYLLSADAVLARQPGQVGDVRSAQDLVGLKVGVRRGSAHEAWARSALVAPGLLQEEDLRSYELAEQAMDDLRQGRIDVVIFDKAAARALMAKGGYAIAGEGLQPQPLAIAVPRGSSQLAAELDRAVAELWRDGTAARLAGEYLDLTAAEITRPPAPSGEAVASTGTTTPPAGCIDGMARVRDLTLDDRGMTAPPQVVAGQRFVKGWKLRNIGTCAWDQSYSLAFVQGSSPLAQMEGSPVTLDGPVPAGAEHDLYAELVAPQTPGIYQGFWQMHNGQGVPFGERVWVGVRIPVPPAPTALPTATPPPGGTFMADHTVIEAGGCVTFTWNFENVRELYFAVQGEADTARGVAGQESRRECPQESSIYELRVIHLDGSEEVRRIPVVVGAGPLAPVIVQFAIMPQTQVRAGQCVDLAWEVQGDVGRLCIFRNDEQIGAGAPLIGSIRDCPPGAGTLVYILQANCPNGIVYARRELTVIP